MVMRVCFNLGENLKREPRRRFGKLFSVGFFLKVTLRFLGLLEEGGFGLFLSTLHVRIQAIYLLISTFRIDNKKKFLTNFEN